MADEERRQLVQRYSEQLDVAVTEFNEDLRALMTEALRGEAERQGAEVEAKLHPRSDSLQQLDQLETLWEQVHPAFSYVHVQKTCRSRRGLTFPLRLSLSTAISCYILKP